MYRKNCNLCFLIYFYIYAIFYAIYYITDENPECDNSTLIGISYDTEFDISKYTELTGGDWKIRGLDRYGNLYSAYSIDTTTDEEYATQDNDYRIYTIKNGINIEINPHDNHKRNTPRHSALHKQAHKRRDRNSYENS